MKNIILIAVLILFPLAALAENLDLKYEAAWTGIKAGTAEVTINKTDNTYNAHVRADAVGLVKTFTHYWSEGSVTGTVTDGKYWPNTLDAKWQPKSSPEQRIVITYGKGGAVNEVATPPENRRKRPEVAEKDKHDLPDQITGGLIAREKARKIIDSGAALPQSFSTRIFDGRRVTDLNFNITGYEPIKLNGKVQKLLKVVFTRTPVTGYNEKELKLHKSMNPTVYIYLDADYIPVYAVGQATIGQVTIKLLNMR